MGVGMALFGLLSLLSLQQATATGGPPPYILYSALWKSYGGESICLQYDLDFSSPSIDLFANCSLLPHHHHSGSVFYANNDLLVYSRCKPDTSYCYQKQICWGPNVGGNRTFHNYGCTGWLDLGDGPDALTAYASGPEGKEVSLAWRGTYPGGGYSIISLTGLGPNKATMKLEDFGANGYDGGNLVVQRNDTASKWADTAVLYTDWGGRLKTSHTIVCSANSTNLTQRSCIDGPKYPFVEYSPVLQSQGDYIIFILPKFKICTTHVSLTSPAWDCIYLPSTASTPQSQIALIPPTGSGEGKLRWIVKNGGVVQVVTAPLPLVNGSVSVTSSFKTPRVTKLVEANRVRADFGLILNTTEGPVVCHNTEGESECTMPMKGWSLSNIVTLDYGLSGYFFKAQREDGIVHFCRHMVRDFPTQPPTCILAQGPKVFLLSQVVGWDHYDEGYGS